MYVYTLPHTSCVYIPHTWHTMCVYASPTCIHEIRITYVYVTWNTHHICVCDHITYAYTYVMRISCIHVGMWCVHVHMWCVFHVYMCICDAYMKYASQYVMRTWNTHHICVCDHPHVYMKYASHMCALPHAHHGEVRGWGRDPFSRNLMSPTPRRKWYLTTGRRFH